MKEIMDWLNGRKMAIGIAIYVVGQALIALGGAIQMPEIVGLGEYLNGVGTGLAGLGAAHKVMKGA